MVKDRKLTLCVSGKLWNRSLIMMDKETDSLWSHLLGEAMAGPLEGGAEEARLQAIEEQFFELTKQLLKEYADRDVTFVLQNWEGDWLLRGTGVNWEADPESSIPSNIDEKIEKMVGWFSARQRSDRSSLPPET